MSDVSTTLPTSLPNPSSNTLEGFTEGRLVVSEKNLHTTDFAKRVVGRSMTPDEINEITLYINTYRAKNQAPPLLWNPTIADFSQQWSHHLLTDNLFQHSNTTLYGENLASFQGMGLDKLVLLKKSVDNWYNEISLYDFSHPGFSSATGHFTCLVWLSSTEYGIAIDIDPTTSKVIVTMNTSPPGNMEGQFPQNVLPHIVDLSNVLVPFIPVTDISYVIIPLFPTTTDISSTTIPPNFLNLLKIQSRNIIEMIRSVIYSIQTRKPTYYLLYQIRSIRNYAMASQIPVSKQIVSMLQTIIIAVQNRATHYYLYSRLQYIIALLHPYSS